MKLDAGLAGEGKHLSGIDETGRTAEDLGFAGLWTSETKHDSFLPLAVAASGTRKLSLGTSVAIAFSRSPMVTAQVAWDLQDLSNGRFILGLGTQVKAHIVRRFSMPWDKPASRLKDYILALRAIWHSFQTEGSLNYEGEFYRHTLMAPFFNPGPIDNPEIPIYIAGVNTRLATLAGELCDGFHVHSFHTPEYVRQVVKPAIAAGAGNENRNLEDVELATSVFVITGESEKEIEDQREKMRAQAAFYASTPTYRTVLDIHGWGEVGEKLGGLAREKKWDEMPKQITDEMLHTFAVEAAPDEVGPALLERYEGLIGRVALYLPFVPGEKDDFWRKVLESVRQARSGRSSAESGPAPPWSRVPGPPEACILAPVVMPHRSGVADGPEGAKILVVDQSVTINRPVKDVFAFMAVVENWAQVQPSLREGGRKAPRRPVEVGDTFRQTLETPGQRIELLGKVTGYERNESLSFEYTRDQLYLDVSFVFESLDGGTLLTTKGGGQLGGFLALFEPRVNGEINAQLKTNLEDIKSRLEFQPGNKRHRL